MSEKTMKLLKRRSKTQDGIVLHTASDFEGMRKAGHVAAQILDDLCERVVPGVTTAALDRFVVSRIRAHKVKSATIGYRGYRHATCISVNYVACHGIPGSYRLVPGDIVNIDVTIIRDGWHGDSSRMYVVGKPKEADLRLIQVTHDALFRGLEQIRPGRTFGDLGSAVEAHVKKHHMAVVKIFSGHGLGRKFHQKPNVVHFGQPNEGPVFVEGMFFTVEPIVSLGDTEIIFRADRWTAVTKDRSRTAQFEHTVGVTRDGMEIFTLSPTDRFHPTNYQLPVQV
ncbi:MAG: type I methionyl aminopeptidase [Rhodobacteraceae bacterium]|nr:type I methionyl aminopeptidase [Paracoccaceae bacterium]